MRLVQRFQLIAGGIAAIALTVVLTLVVEHKIVHGDAPAIAQTGNAVPMLAMLHPGGNAVYCYNTGASTVDAPTTPIDYQVNSTSNPITIVIKNNGLPQNTITITNARLVQTTSTTTTAFNDTTCPSS
jgi:hypothetical protein